MHPPWQIATPNNELFTSTTCVHLYFAYLGSKHQALKHEDPVSEISLGGKVLQGSRPSPGNHGQNQWALRWQAVMSKCPHKAVQATGEPNINVRLGGNRQMPKR